MCLRYDHITDQIHNKIALTILNKHDDELHGNTCLSRRIGGRNRGKFHIKLD